MEALWYQPRRCWRVIVPRRLSETGKRCRRFFQTKGDAEKYILEIKRRGSVQLADLSIEEIHVLGVIRQSQKYAPGLLLEAWQRFESEGIRDGKLTVEQLCDKFLARDRVDLLPAVPLISLDELAGAWVDRSEFGSLRFRNRGALSSISFCVVHNWSD
jgi:hypothetical protein